MSAHEEIIQTHQRYLSSVRMAVSDRTVLTATLKPRVFFSCLRLTDRERERERERERGGGGSYDNMALEPCLTQWGRNEPVGQK